MENALEKFVIGIVAMMVSVAAGGRYSGGDGTADDPFRIGSADDLLAMSADPNNWDKCFVQIADIDLSGYVFDQAVIAPDGPLQIGRGIPFQGVFDGQDHAIRNLLIIALDTSNVGLFGMMNGAVVRNVHIVQGCLVTAPYLFGCGLLAGSCRDSIVWDCSTSGILQGTAGAGGMVGKAARCEILRCWSSVSIWDPQGDSEVGGLVGELENGLISQCHATGDISSDGTRYTCIGGLVGRNSGKVIDCYAQGNVTFGHVNHEMGGLIGQNAGLVLYCFSTGRVSALNGAGGLIGDSTAGVVLDCVWDQELSGLTTGAGGTGRTTAQMCSSATFQTWAYERDVWTIDEGKDHPRLAWEKRPGMPITMDRIWYGNGTPDSPYIIKTPAELDWIGRIYSVWDKYFLLYEDLDMAAYSYNRGLISFEIIPDPCDLIFGRYLFSGVIDGNGHSISNLTINANESGSSNLGLIGTLGPKGKVKNLHLRNAVIIGGGKFIGAIAGRNSGGVIEDCTVDGIFQAFDNAGGLVGYNTGDILRCRSESYGFFIYAFIGKGRVGGLIGCNEGTVEASVSEGMIILQRSSCYNIGGLVGGNDGGRIVNCYSTTAILGEDGHKYLGGLVGLNRYEGIVMNCYAAGMMTSWRSVKYCGGLVGQNDLSFVHSSFWDMESIGNYSSDGGVGKTTEQMRSLETFRVWGGLDDWVMVDGQDYPRLAWEDPYSSYDPIPHQGYSQGDGSEKNPYRISTKEEFLRFCRTAYDWNRQFQLAQDLYFDDDADDPLSEEDVVGMFTGVFDGNGHTITGLHIYSDQNQIGLFRRLEPGSVVRNLRLAHLGIGCTDDIWYVGGLAGMATNSMIVDCHISGSIGGPKEMRIAGGLIGDNNGSTVRRCSSICGLYGQGVMGGLVGSNDGLIQECFAAGHIQGVLDFQNTSGLASIIGGLVGDNSGMVQDSYSNSVIEGSVDIYSRGGLCGFSSGYNVLRCYSATKGADHFFGSRINEAFVRGCFMAAENSQPYPKSAVNLLSDAEMKNQTHFLGAGWDFVGESDNGTSDVWRMCGDGIDHPRLSWEFSTAGDLACPDGVELQDLLYLSERWTAASPQTVGAADANGDGKVDMLDLTLVAEGWLR